MPVRPKNRTAKYLQHASFRRLQTLARKWRKFFALVPKDFRLSGSGVNRDSLAEQIWVFQNEDQFGRDYFNREDGGVDVDFDDESDVDARGYPTHQGSRGGHAGVTCSDLPLGMVQAMMIHSRDRTGHTAKQRPARGVTREQMCRWMNRDDGAEEHSNEVRKMATVANVHVAGNVDLDGDGDSDEVDDELAADLGISDTDGDGEVEGHEVAAHVGDQDGDGDVDVVDVRSAARKEWRRMNAAREQGDSEDEDEEAEHVRYQLPSRVDEELDEDSWDETDEDVDYDEEQDKWKARRRMEEADTKWRASSRFREIQEEENRRRMPRPSAPPQNAGFLSNLFGRR